MSDLQKVAQAAREVADLGEEMIQWAYDTGQNLDPTNLAQSFVNIVQSFLSFAENLEAIAQQEAA